MKPRLLDLFSGAGGCARGYQLAGFHVTGVDNRPQPRYAGDVFVLGDALEFCERHGGEFDVIHASPPCQAHTSIRNVNPGREYPDLIPATRDLLLAAGRPYVIENVPGAKTLRPLLLLCGTMFGLRTPCGAQLRRHRYFEINWSPGLVPPCAHGGPVVCITGHTAEDPRFSNHMPKAATIGIHGAVPRDPGVEKRRFGRRRTITVTGCTPQQNVVRNQERYTFSVEAARIAMGIDWGPLPMRELSQAIPPAYTHFVGRQLLAAIGAP